jgi:hypothetical protein
MGAQRSANVLEMRTALLLADLERMIDARVDARLQALDVGKRALSRRELRLKAGFINLRDLATAAQVSACWISMLEHGQIGHPGARSRAGLERLCAALGVDVFEYCTARTDGERTR